MRKYGIYSPRLDNCEHFTYYLPFVHMAKRGISTDYLPTPSCPLSYWMTHDGEIFFVNQFTLHLLSKE